VANPVEVERGSWRITVAAVLLLLVFANVMANRVIPNSLYLPWNLAVAGALVWLASHEVSREEMGFTGWRRGLQWGGALFGGTAAVLLVGRWLPFTRDMFHDTRVAGSVWAWAYHALLRIPFGTALMEETAFRAVLPAVLALRWGVLRGCIAASVLFGFWHVLPSLGLHKANSTVSNLLGTGAVGVVVTVALTVVGTAVVGLLWCWIRYRSGSILATILGHVATNSVAYTIAFWTNR
jgi:membrane protease YdiL (CAAX protease family)